MRVKEVDKTANVAWSPALQHPVYIAAGTAAQQLDATFRYALPAGYSYSAVKYILLASGISSA